MKTAATTSHSALLTDACGFQKSAFGDVAALAGFATTGPSRWKCNATRGDARRLAACGLSVSGLFIGKILQAAAHTTFEHCNEVGGLIKIKTKVLNKHPNPNDRRAVAIKAPFFDMTRMPELAGGTLDPSQDNAMVSNMMGQTT